MWSKGHYIVVYVVIWKSHIVSNVDIIMVHESLKNGIIAQFTHGRK